ncbi:hypothetical protein ACFVWR_06950 [Leifsonia sp. NPDC058292]|uniref:hypothetical protein n=1 Tax=Leifsonia sp. NPDC058292 TaxID=3346428 RepID=UPI0036DE5402
MNDHSLDGEDLARRVNRNIRTVIGGDHLAAVAEKTGLDPDRVAEIVRGALPDSFELIRFELGYRQTVWPDPAGSPIWESERD